MKKLAVVGLWLACTCLSAHAQESVEHFQRTLQQIQRDTQATIDQELPPDRRALIDYGGYLTLSYLSFDDATHDNHALRGYGFVGYGLVNLDGAHEFYFRGRADYRDYNPGDRVDDIADQVQGRVEEGWYRFDLQRFASAYQHRELTGDVAVKLGRQFVSWGNGLTLDQYVDGGFAEIRKGPVSVNLLGCLTVPETIDFDITRPHFYNNTQRGYFGAIVTAPIGRQKPYAYFLAQRDYTSGSPLNAHVIPTRYEYDSYYAGIGANGALSDNLAYAGEFCFEGGHDLSNSFSAATNEPVRQTNDRIEAYAADARIDYLPNDARRSRFTAEGILASGDRNRLITSGTFGGSRPHSVDHAFNSLGVRYVGLAFAPPMSNLLMLRLGASAYPLPHTRPFRELQAGIDLFVFGKTEQNAPIDEPTTSRHYLGVEPDLFVNWQITEDVTLAIRYGVFFPGAAIPSGDAGHIRQFVYSGLTYAF
jgi:hypothetical protein